MKAGHQLDVEYSQVSTGEARDTIRLFHLALDRVRTIDRRLAVSGKISDFYDQMIRDLMDLMEAKYGALGLYDEHETIINFIAHGMSEEEKARLKCPPQGRGLLRFISASENAIRIDNVPEDPRSVGYPAGHPVMKTLIGVGVRLSEKVSGVLYLAEKTGGRKFLDIDMSLLEVYAKEIENAIQKNDLINSLKSKNTEIENSQQQLLQSEKMASIGVLAAGIAHEINNPVGYVNSNLETLQKYIQSLVEMIQAYQTIEPALADRPDMAEFLRNSYERLDIGYIKDDVLDLVKETREGTARIRKIVQDLKEFSHVDRPDWQQSDIHAGMDSTLNIVRNEIKYKAEVIKEYGELPPVECISPQINQVFMNLLVNAAQAIPDKGKIIIKTGMDDNNCVYVRISDTGKGISEENMKRLFQPFFTTKPVGKGTGLGLSLSYNIIQKHNGRIDVESREGVGTTFTVWLPVSQPRDTVGSKEAP